MEKFSKFNDPSSGVNPFIQPKSKSLSCINYIKFAVFYPFYLLSFIFPFILSLIFTIKIDSKFNKNFRVGICNSSSYLDKRLLRLFFGVENFYYVRDCKYYELNGRECKKIAKPCFLFPEGTSTNNRAVLKHEVPTKVDVVCFIKYSEVFVYGSFFKYLVSILSNGLKIEIKTSESQDLSSLGGVPTVKFNYKDKEQFIKELN
ncbi:hypothetical protein NGRA_0564 [Nosema granulosis]|uniref:Phospholipid/glycerol acyltransferase domain-containing protein n=1 Tax=Nosema granulosis TaxID=83296 RepID=A0A9P6L0F7_9MICR|nr:hypothetical protein NGRA_0564 [Nosema granulosis]